MYKQGKFDNVQVKSGITTTLFNKPLLFDSALLYTSFYLRDSHFNEFLNSQHIVHILV
jgi:hypothetical protein